METQVNQARRQRVASQAGQQEEFWREEIGRYFDPSGGFCVPNCGEELAEGKLDALVSQCYEQDAVGSVHPKRDPVGGTLLHWCVLLGCGAQRRHFYRATAKYIIEKRGTDVLDMQFNRRASQPKLPFEDLHYDGETALHVAVAKNDTEIVRALLDKGANMQLRAYGSFFMPGGDAACYFGEYPLSFAAACGHDNMVRLLVEYPGGEDSRDLLLERDSFSNTAMHVAVLHNRKDTYRTLDKLVRKLHPTKTVATMRGSFGMTPLSLAALFSCRTQDCEPFNTVLETTRSLQWSFGDVTAHSYPLEQIDTANMLEADAPNYMPVLYLVVVYYLLPLADNHILVSLLESKWVYLRWMFYMSILWHFAYLACLTCLTVRNHPYGREPDELDWVTTTMLTINSLSTVADVVLGLQEWRALRALQVRDPVTQQVDSGIPSDVERSMMPYEVYTVGGRFRAYRQLLVASLLSVFDVLAWAGYVLYFIHLAADSTVDPGTTLEEKDKAPVPWTVACLGLSTMCAWLSTLTYAPVHERTGMLVTMMTRTIFRDLLPFLLVFSFILVGASAGAYSLQGSEDFTLPATIDVLKRLSIGLYAFEAYEPGGHGEGVRQVSYILILLFTVVSSLLMLNLLIATFTSTYEEVKDLAHKEWRLQWGRAIIRLERRCIQFANLRSVLRVNHGSSKEHRFVSIWNQLEESLQEMGEANFADLRSTGHAASAKLPRSTEPVEDELA